MWVRVFNLWVRVFNLHFPDKMKSCRHKRHDENLVATREVGASFPIPCGCEFSTCTSPTRWKSCRHKRNDARLPPQGIEIALFHQMGYTLPEPKSTHRFC